MVVRHPGGREGFRRSCWDWFGTRWLGKNKLAPGKEEIGEHWKKESGDPGASLRRPWTKWWEGRGLALCP